MWEPTNEILSPDEVVSKYGTDITSPLALGWVRGNDYLVPIYYQGYTLTFEVGTLAGGYISLAFPTTKELHKSDNYFDGSRVSCLRVSISDGEADIEQILVKNDPRLPTSKIGTWLLHLGVAIAAGLKATTCKITDCARIKHNGTPVSLLYYRLFHGRQASWYRQYGFESFRGTDTTEDEERLRNIPANTISIPKYNTCQPLPNENLATYMLRLMDVDVNMYIQQVRQLTDCEVCGDIVFRIKSATHTVVKKL